MTETKTLVLLSLLLSAVSGIFAFIHGNWMWMVVCIVCVIVLVIPETRDLGYYYDRKLVALTMVGPVAAILITVLNPKIHLDDLSLLDVTGHMYCIQAIQAYQCFVLGFMIALVLDRSYGLKMTNSWLIIFSLAFTMTMSAVSMFYLFGLMYSRGYPVFNEDFYDSEVYTNAILMIAPVASTIVSMVMAVLLYLRIRSRDKTDFLAEARA